MDLTHQLNRMLSELGMRHQIPNMRLIPDGTLRVKLKDGAELNFRFIESSNAFFIHTVLAELPADSVARLDLFKTMLDLNCRGLGAKGGVLSLCRRSKQILYQKEIALAGLDVDTLDRLLHQVLTDSARLARLLKQPRMIEENSFAPH